MPEHTPLLPRGVYAEPYRVDGWPVLVAVDSAGDAIACVKLGPEVTRAQAKRWLLELLDRRDPASAPPPHRIRVLH